MSERDYDLSKDAPGTLTVIMRNNAPLVHLGEPCTHRTVQIKLTQEQLDQIRLRYTHSANTNHFHEDIAQVFLEESK